MQVELHTRLYFFFSRPSQSNKPLVTGHPKMGRLEQVVLDHFNTFNKGLYVTKIDLLCLMPLSDVTKIMEEQMNWL
jgi:hypothetical protein